MNQDISYGGRELKEMFTAGSNWLEKSVPDVNAINVFPVPDGDTGTNMHLTMRSTLEEADRALDDSVSEIAKAMAQGALMGARGNSGVILSQFFRGLAKGFDDKKSINGSDLAAALMEASHTAYKGLSKPTEGTMLTVMREAATVAETCANSKSHELITVMEAAVNEARESVSRTPLLLPVLKEAGVVDAGGQGIYVLLEGALRYLKGEAEEMEYSKPSLVTANLPAKSAIPISVIEQDDPYGYCTNFLLVGQKLNPDKIRQRLEGKGQSVVVAGDSVNIRVHIHTYDPGAILRYATSLGTLHHIQIQNMDDQHEGFIEMQQEQQPTMDIAVVAVAAGSGISEVFKSLGTAAIVPGGQTMNPSVKEVLAAVDAVPSERVIILPNNKNIILTASQIEPLTSKKVAVIPTKTVPQGIAALLSFNYEGTLEDNVKAMEDAVAMVKTVEITRAVRSTQMNGMEIKEGQIIGIVDDSELVATGDGAQNVLYDTLSKAGIDAAEVVTLYYGNDVEPDQADEIIKVIQDKYPAKQVELINGGQPHYDYIVSLE